MTIPKSWPKNVKLPLVMFAPMGAGIPPPSSPEVIAPEIWENKVDDTVVASRMQIPLRLAWSLSVHKSQGMTIPNLEVGLRGVFEYGQGYVALSRATQLSTLLLRDFDARSFRAHPKVKQFYEILDKVQKERNDKARAGEGEEGERREKTSTTTTTTTTTTQSTGAENQSLNQHGGTMVGNTFQPSHKRPQREDSNGVGKKPKITLPQSRPRPVLKQAKMPTGGLGKPFVQPKKMAAVVAQAVVAPAGGEGRGRGGKSGGLSEAMKSRMEENRKAALEKQALTGDQKKRMEENRRAALEKRKQRAAAAAAGSGGGGGGGGGGEEGGGGSGTGGQSQHCPIELD